MLKVMKYFGWSLLLWINTFHVNGQTKTYDFVTALPPESADLMAIPPKLYGEYYDSVSEQTVTVKQRGIFTSKTVYGHLPFQAINDTSSYQFRNNLLFGVVKNDSLPCFLKDSVYYFGMVKKSELFSFNGSSTMRKVNVEQNNYDYLISFQEKGYWIPMILSFEEDRIVLKRAVFEELEDPFSNIVVRFHEEKNGLMYIHLHPSLDEWESLPLNDYFKAEQTFMKK